MSCRRLCRPPVLLLALVLGAGGVRTAQAVPLGSAALTFSSDVGVVNVHVTVTQGEGVVAGLAAGDFEVHEGEGRQEVAFFAQQEVPVTYTLLVDTSGSMQKRAGLVFEALRRFVGSLRPGDRASIVTFGLRAKVVQEETADASALLAATARIPETFDDGTALYEVLYGEFHGAAGRAGDQGPRRHALVVFSDGKDETSRRSFRSAVLDAARRADLAVYPVALARRDAFLEQLARETGGRVSYVSHASQLAEVYDAIGAELASQYTIGYLPSTQPQPGAWRPVRVKVTRKGTTVRHRTGYFTPGPATSAD